MSKCRHDRIYLAGISADDIEVFRCRRCEAIVLDDHLVRRAWWRGFRSGFGRGLGQPLHWLVEWWDRRKA